MDLRLRKVVRIPLDELWRVDGKVIGSRERTLGSSKISSLLRKGPIEFVIADVGEPLIWIAVEDCFDFWKAEVKPHLAEANSQIAIEAFPDMYCYIASQWK